MMFNLISLSVLYAPPEPPVSQVSSAVIQSMRQHQDSTSGDGQQAGDGTLGYQEVDEDQMDAQECGEPTWPETKVDYEGPKHKGVLQQLFDIGDAKPLDCLTGGLFNVMQSFNEAAHWGKATFLKAISSISMTSVFGSFLRGYLKLFKKFRNRFFVISSTAFSKFLQMIAHWFDNAQGSGAAPEQADAANTAAEAQKKPEDDHERAPPVDMQQRQFYAESDERERIRRGLSLGDFEELEKLRVHQVNQSNIGGFAPSFGGHGGQQQDGFESPWAPDKNAMRMRRRQMLGIHG